MNYTEDDTFEALRRIPQSQMREKLDDYALWFENIREIHHSNVAANKKIAFWNRVRSFFHIKQREYAKDLSSEFLIEDIGHIMQGTGWAIESYTEAIDKPILQRRAEIKQIKRKRTAYIVGSYLVSITFCLSVCLILNMGWLSGYLLGMSFGNFAVIFHPIMDKFWPYPDYCHRYE